VKLVLVGNGEEEEEEESLGSFKGRPADLY
jgi:hypothetical protein